MKYTYYNFRQLTAGLIMLCCLATQPPTPPSEGGLKSKEFIIQKDRKNVLPKADRLFTPAPSAPQQALPSATISYHIPTVDPTFDPLTRKVWILRAQQDVPTSTYSNYAQGSLGTYWSSKLQLYFDRQYKQLATYGLHLAHRASSGWQDQRHHTNGAQLYGKLFTPWGTFQGHGAYDRKAYQQQAASRASNLWHAFALQSTWGLPTTAWQAQAGLNHLRDADQARELHGKLGVQWEHQLPEAMRLSCVLGAHRLGYSEKRYQQVANAQAYLHLPIKKLNVTGGANLAHHHAPHSDQNHFSTYPYLHLHYPISPHLRPYAGLEGKVQPVSLQALIEENPLLISNAVPRPLVQPWQFYGGIKSSLAHQWEVHSGLSWGGYRNLHYFVNADQSPGQFEVCYDDSEVLNVFLETSHAASENPFSLRLRADYFHYACKALANPWHRPSYQLEVQGSYNWHRKVIFEGKLHSSGGRKAREANGTAKLLDSVLDLDLGIDYLFNPQLTVFLKGDNLLFSSATPCLGCAKRSARLSLGLAYAW